MIDLKAESMTAEAIAGEGRDGDGPLAQLVVARLRWALSGQAADPPSWHEPPVDRAGPPIDLAGLA